MRCTRTLLTALMVSIVLGCQPKSQQPPPTQSAPSNGSAPAMASSETADALGGNEDPLLRDEEPLLLDDEPLLLDDEPGEDSDHWADNSRCHVCHINYATEKLAVTHAKQGMGCADCHGQSDEHIADESWASGGNGTAPDRMFPRDTVNPFCFDCHKPDSLPRSRHKAVLTDPPRKVCTDCHGKHRLAVRKCKWK